MRFHFIAHRIFLFVMFIVCSLAVIAFARSKVDASILYIESSTTLNQSSPTIANTTTNTTTLSKPTSSSQTINQPTASSDNTIETATTAKDTVSDGTTSDDTKEQPTNNQTGTLSTSNTTSQTSTSQSSTPSTQTATSASSVKNQTNETSVSTTKNTTTISADEKTETKSATANNTSGVYVNKMIEVEPAANVLPPLNEGAEAEINIITEPVVIKESEFPKEKNPKLEGSVNQKLEVKKVELVKKESGKNNLRLEGQALPNTIVTLYIFSDPIVITLKADENGNWSYELSKELEDGQHEVYLAVTEENGKVVSKSEPIAFVKTAQAASVIPYSEFEANKSPMQRSTASYILIAIVIMSVCLAVALAMIGILSHKYKTDETIIE